MQGELHGQVPAAGPLSAERPWRRTDGQRFRELPFELHAVLAGIPLHDSWELDLPGAGAKYTIADTRALLSAEALREVSPVVRFLFGLRAAMGRWFKWDAKAETPRESKPERHFVSPEILAQSRAEPGTSDGPFVLLYALDEETVSEIRNATVHAFSALALERTDFGTRVHWGIYVEPVGGLTTFYMALIAPFRRYLVYPAILQFAYDRWMARAGADQ